jgi:hypothetical protein
MAISATSCPPKRSDRYAKPPPAGVSSSTALRHCGSRSAICSMRTRSSTRSSASASPMRTPGFIRAMSCAPGGAAPAGISRASPAGTHAPVVRPAPA